MDGIFVPKEILELQDLNGMEKLALSLYKYFTEKGKNKCCSLTNGQVADELGMSLRYIKTIKKHLKEIGYIRTDGGIKVIYVGLTQGNNSSLGGEQQLTGGVNNSSPQGEQQLTGGVNNSSPQGGTIAHPGGEQQLTGGVNNSSPQGGTIAHPGGEQQLTHKEEKKLEKKEIKKEIKEELSEEEKIIRSNLKLIINKLYPTYRTQEKIKFLYDNFKEKLSSADFTEGGTLDSYVQCCQNILLKEFPIEQVVPISKKSDTIDMF